MKLSSGIAFYGLLAFLFAPCNGLYTERLDYESEPAMPPPVGNVAAKLNVKRATPSPSPFIQLEWRPTAQSRATGSAK